MEAFLTDVEQEIEELKQPKQNLSAEDELWWQQRNIEHEETYRYGSIFDNADYLKQGFITAPVCFRLLSRSKLLSPTLIAQILTLVDLRGKGQFNKKEFILALHLAKCHIEEAKQLPFKLPFSLTRDATKDTIYGQLPNIVDNQYGYIPDDKAPKRDMSHITIKKEQGLYPSYKICIVGDQCGKTSFVNRLLFDDFEDGDDPTVEQSFDFDYKFEGKTYHVTLLDTSGNDCFLDSMHEKWFSDSEGFLMVCSVASQHSFSTVESIRTQALKDVKKKEAPFVLAVTKYDLPSEEHQLSSTDITRYKETNQDIEVVEVSAKTGVNVEEAFEALLSKILDTQRKAQANAQQKANEESAISPKMERWKATLRGMGSSRKGSYETLRGDEPLADPTSLRLLDTLKDSQKFENFKSFLSKKYPSLVPQLSFWKAVEDYKLKDVIHERHAQANLIHSSFFYGKTPLYDLQISEKVASDLRRSMKADTLELNLFNVAQLSVFEQIKAGAWSVYEDHLILDDSRYASQRDYKKEEKRPVSPINIVETKSTPVAVIGASRSVDWSKEPLLKSTSIDNIASFSNNNNDITPVMPFTSPGSTYGGIPVLQSVNDWYFSDITRPECENILINCPVDAFLVRISSKQNCYALSRCNLKMKNFIHFVIGPTANGGYQIEDFPDDRSIYSSLSELVTKSPVVKGYVSAGKFKQ